PVHITLDPQITGELTAAVRSDAEQRAVLRESIDDGAADVLDVCRGVEPDADRRRPGLIQRERGIPAGLGRGELGLRAARAPGIRMIDETLQRPGGIAVGMADIGDAANAQVTR